METKIENKKSMIRSHKSGTNKDFYSLMDRLQASLEWKFPNRIWTNDMYYSLAWEWFGKHNELIDRVLKLEQEIGEIIFDNCEILQCYYKENGQLSIDGDSIYAIKRRSDEKIYDILDFPEIIESLEVFKNKTKH